MTALEKAVRDHGLKGGRVRPVVKMLRTLNPAGVPDVAFLCDKVKALDDEQFEAMVVQFWFALNGGQDDDKAPGV